MKSRKTTDPFDQLIEAAISEIPDNEGAEFDAIDDRGIELSDRITQKIEQIIREEILRLKEEGATIILSTHNMESVEELCDNIALINKSHVVITGGVEEIRRKYGNDNVELVYTGDALKPACSVFNILSDVDEGGRHTPFFNNYRPQFFFRTTDVTGIITLPDGVEMCNPGDNVNMNVELIVPIAMEEGLRFAIREGGRTVGSGVVSKILG